MGLLDFLFAGAIINNAKKARRDNSQSMQERASDYNHEYEDGYDDCCYDHIDYDNCECHDTYDCEDYDDDNNNECDW